MASKLSEIEADAEFQGLEPREQDQIRLRFLQRYVLNDPEYLGLPVQDRADIANRVMRGPKPKPTLQGPSEEDLSEVQPSLYPARPTMPSVVPPEEPPSSQRLGPTLEGPSEEALAELQPSLYPARLTAPVRVPTLGPVSPPSAALTPPSGAFHAEGSGYDQERALRAGMVPDVRGHWGSVAPTTPEERSRLGLPPESYVLLKGRTHETWDLAEQEEQRRGFKVVNVGGRYYSVPKDWEAPGASYPSEGYPGYDVVQLPGLDTAPEGTVLPSSRSLRARRPQPEPGPGVLAAPTREQIEAETGLPPEALPRLSQPTPPAPPVVAEPVNPWFASRMQPRAEGVGLARRAIEPVVKAPIQVRDPMDPLTGGGTGEAELRERPADSPITGGLGWMARQLGIDQRPGITPPQIAKAQIEREARGLGKTPEEYMAEVEPQGKLNRIGTRIGNELLSGASSTVHSTVRGAAVFLSSPNLMRTAENMAAFQSELEAAPDDQTFFYTAVNGLGSSAVFFVPGFAVARGTNFVSRFGPRLATELGLSVMSAGEALSEAGDSYKRAKEAGLSEGAAMAAASRTFWLNVPTIYLTERFGFFGETGSRFLRWVVSGQMEGLQEAIQSIIQSKSMGKAIDWNDVATSYGVGLVVGAVMGGAQQTLGTLPTVPDAAQQAEEQATLDALDETVLGLGYQVPALPSRAARQRPGMRPIPPPSPIDTALQAEILAGPAPPGQAVEPAAGFPLGLLAPQPIGPSPIVPSEAAPILPTEAAPEFRPAPGRPAPVPPSVQTAPPVSEEPPATVEQPVAPAPEPEPQPDLPPAEPTLQERIRAAKDQEAFEVNGRTWTAYGEGNTQFWMDQDGNAMTTEELVEHSLRPPAQAATPVAPAQPAVQEEQPPPAPPAELEPEPEPARPSGWQGIQEVRGVRGTAVGHDSVIEDMGSEDGKGYKAPPGQQIALGERDDAVVQRMIETMEAGRGETPTLVRDEHGQPTKRLAGGKPEWMKDPQTNYWWDWTRMRTLLDNLRAGTLPPRIDRRGHPNVTEIRKVEHILAMLQGITPGLESEIGFVAQQRAAAEAVPEPAPEHEIPMTPEAQKALDDFLAGEIPEDVEEPGGIEAEEPGAAPPPTAAEPERPAPARPVPERPAAPVEAQGEVPVPPPAAAPTTGIPEDLQARIAELSAQGKWDEVEKLLGSGTLTRRTQRGRLRGLAGRILARQEPEAPQPGARPPLAPQLQDVLEAGIHQAYHQQRSKLPDRIDTVLKIAQHFERALTERVAKFTTAGRRATLPLPVAELATHLADPRPGESFLAYPAETGALAVALPKGSESVVVEDDPGRREMLKKMGRPAVEPTPAVFREASVQVVDVRYSPSPTAEIMLAMQGVPEGSRLVAILPTYPRAEAQDQFRRDMQTIQEHNTVRGAFTLPASAFSGRTQDPVNASILVIDKGRIPDAERALTVQASTLEEIAAHVPTFRFGGSRGRIAYVPPPAEAGPAGPGGELPPGAPPGVAAPAAPEAGAPAPEGTPGPPGSSAPRPGGAGGAGGPVRPGGPGAGPGVVAPGGRPGAGTPAEPEAGGLQEAPGVGLHGLGQRGEQYSYRNPADFRAAQRSGSFAPAPLVGAPGRSPHLRLVVGSRGLLGVERPTRPYTVESMGPVVSAAYEAERISDQQLDYGVAPALQGNERGHGFLCAADVGVGKTRVAAGAVATWIHQGKAKRILYITARNVNIGDAVADFKAFAGGTYPATLQNVIEFPESVRRPDGSFDPFPFSGDSPTVFFVTHHRLVEFTPAILAAHFDTVIADEPHLLKNIDGSQRGRAWIDIQLNAFHDNARSIYLTATPAVDFADLEQYLLLREWAPQSFQDWKERVTGNTPEQMPVTLSAATEKYEEIAEKLRLAFARAEIADQADAYLDSLPIADLKRAVVRPPIGMEGLPVRLRPSPPRLRPGLRGELVERPGLGVEPAPEPPISPEATAGQVIPRPWLTIPATYTEAQEIAALQESILLAQNRLQWFDVPKPGEMQRGGGRVRGDPFNVLITPQEQEQIMRELVQKGKFDSVDLWRSGVEFDVVANALTDEQLVEYRRLTAFVQEVNAAFRKGRSIDRQWKHRTPRAMFQGEIKRRLFDYRLQDAVRAARHAMHIGEQVVIAMISVSPTKAESGNIGSILGHTDRPGDDTATMINTVARDYDHNGRIKFERLVPELEEERQRLINVWRTEFRMLPAPLAYFQAELGTDNVGAIIGEMSDRQREKALQAFQSGRLPVMIISDAGKVGINLHHAAWVPTPDAWFPGLGLRKEAPAAAEAALAAPTQVFPEPDEGLSTYEDILQNNGWNLRQVNETDGMAFWEHPDYPDHEISLNPAKFGVDSPKIATAWKHYVLGAEHSTVGHDSDSLAQHLEEFRRAPYDLATWPEEYRPTRRFGREAETEPVTPRLEPPAATQGLTEETWGERELRLAPTAGPEAGIRAAERVRIPSLRRAPYARLAPSDRAFEQDQEEFLRLINEGVTARPARMSEPDWTERARWRAGRRRMLLLDVDWSADVWKQALGRVDRTGQLSAPGMTGLSKGLKAEMKFWATIANRMRDLGSIAKGQADAASAADLSSMEMGGELDTHAMRMAWMNLPTEVKSQFLSRQWYDDNGDLLQGYPGRAKLKPFLLDLMFMEPDASNAAFDAFWALRERYIREQQEAEDQLGLPKKTRIMEGAATRLTSLRQGLNLVEVRDLHGHRFGILSGLVSDYMSIIRHFLPTTQAGRVQRQYVSFKAGDTIVSGLLIRPSMVPILAEKFGRTIGRRFENWGDVWEAIHAGDRVFLSGPEQIILRLRRTGGDIIAENAHKLPPEIVSRLNGSRVVGGFLVGKDGVKVLFQERPPLTDRPSGAKPAVQTKLPGGPKRQGGGTLARRGPGRSGRAATAERSLVESGRIPAGGVEAFRRAAQGRIQQRLGERATPAAVEEAYLRFIQGYAAEPRSGALPATPAVSPAAASALAGTGTSRTLPAELAQLRGRLHERLQAILKIPLRTGRMRRRSNVLGFFKYPEHIIRVRVFHDVQSLLHEAGHWIDTVAFGRMDRPSPRRNALYSRFESELTALASAHAKPSPEEGVAEFIRMWLTDPSIVAQHPGLAQAIIGPARQADPEMVKALEDFRDNWYVPWREQDLATRLRQHFVMDPIADPFNLRQSLQRLHTSIFESTGPAKTVRDYLMEAAGATSVPASEDFYVMLRMLAGTPRLVELFLFKKGGGGAIDFHERKRVGKSLEEVFEPLRPLGPEGELDFFAWATTKRIEEMAERARRGDKKAEKELAAMSTTLEAINPRHQFGPVTPRDSWQQAERQLRRPEFDRVLRDLNEWDDALMAYATASGLFTPEEMLRIRMLNRNWIPWSRVFMEAEHVTGAVQSPGLGAHRPPHSIRGSGRVIWNPGAAIVSNAYAIIARAERNNVLQLFHRWARQVPGAGLFVEKVPPPLRVTKFQLKEIESTLLAAGVPLKLIQELVVGAAGPPTTTTRQRTTEEYEKLLETLIQIYRPDWSNLGPNDILVFNHGKKTVLEIHPPELRRALLQLDRTEAAWIDHVIETLPNPTWFPAAQTAKWLVFGPAILRRLGATTLSPEWMLRNPFRDIMTRAAYMRQGAQHKAGLINQTFWPYINLATATYQFAQALGDVFGQRKWTEAFLRGGGAITTLASQDQESMRKSFEEIMGRRPQRTAVGRAARRLALPYDVLRYLSDRFELANRVAEFRSVLEAQGVTPETASKSQLVGGSFAGREVTVDWNVAGSGIRRLALNRMSAFFNPNLQAYRRLGHEINLGLRGENNRRWWHLLYFFLASVTLPSILLWLYNQGDPRWKDVPAFHKTNSWVILTGSAPEDYDQLSAEEKTKVYQQTALRIPLPFEPGIIFGAIPVALLDFIQDKEPDFAGRLISIFSNMLLGLVPFATTLEPIVESMANRRFYFGTPIEPKGMDYVEPKERRFPRTSGVAIAVAEAIDALPGSNKLPEGMRSPLHIENLLFSYTAGGGRLVSDAIDYGVELFEGQHWPERTWSDVPMVRGFTVRMPSHTAPIIERFYDLAKPYRQITGTLRLLKSQARGEEGETRVQEYQEEHKRDWPMVMLMAGTEFKMGMLMRRIRAIQGSERTSEEQRNEIDKLTLQRIEEARKAVRIYDTWLQRREEANPGFTEALHPTGLRRLRGRKIEPPPVSP